MTQGFSKKNQSSPDSSYRFGNFELHPGERLLKTSGLPVPLQPKAFDALLCLVRKAEHLVSKQELIDTLWPSVHVSEANLTNTIVSLRKIVGRDAIRTVSKHGYRFELAVTGEPGVAQAAYEKFARAKELTAQRSLDSMLLARDLYWTCLAEDPSFAPAWAWLGRCCWFLDKFSATSSANLELAHAAFLRAFALDPDLASAHQFYTFVQVDTGHAADAMVRLLERLKQNPREPESFTSLVQVLRFRGMLPQSIDAHRRAVRLDPAVITSVAHTLFLSGDYASAIETYSGRAAYYLDAAAWAALGNRKRAVSLLRERLDKMPLSPLMTALLSSLLSLLEGRTEEAINLMKAADTTREPEILLYFARHYSRMKKPELAITALKQAAQSGFICAPHTLTSDPWFSTLRRHPQFNSLRDSMQTLVDEAQSTLDRYTV
ncbi:winged helix-turn-helix domain-containing protein [Granulicella sp. S190]|uniref:winged helix-turn-helix domain-containing protein n=1 Tax=Granulicella sp. S190 TaxID=1747226 RepID=UPI00131DACB9|nr:winged helix-turn-helix domain-containing protein [Granulicella sp. S190]